MRWLCVALVLAACGKGATGSEPRDSLLFAWKKAGLDVSAFTPATTKVGKDCASGTVDKLDVLVCAFPTADEATKAQDAGLAWVGDTTGVSRAKGALVIAVADRHKADPSGKTINKLFDVAP